MEVYLNLLVRRYPSILLLQFHQLTFYFIVIGISLIRLNSLCLEYNKLTGEIPILRNNALQTLSLAHNQLSGNIPVLQFQFQLETDIYINNNLLTGSIPNALGIVISFQSSNLFQS